MTTGIRTEYVALLLWIALLGASAGTPAIAAQADSRGARPTLMRTAPPPQSDYSISIKIEPAEHVGPCPVKVAFIATITAKKAGPVRYHLRTSDNANDPVRELMFTAPGTKSFAVTRNLPPPGSGWALFEIVGPQAVTSETAYYDVQCTNDPGAAPERTPSAAAQGPRSVAEANARATIPAAREAAGARGAAQKPPLGGQAVAQASVDVGMLVPKPDLVITGVTGSHVKSQATAGSLVWKFLVEIRNTGPAEAGGSLLCAHAEPAKAPQASKNPVPNLASQQSAKVEYWYSKPSWAFLEGGERTKRPLVFVADCEGSVTEASEANNQYSVWLYWDPTEAKTWEPAQQ